MINFACKCGHKFSVLDDMSGGTVQCPQCRLLVDVPYLGDIGNLENDGTFKVEEVPLKDEQRQRLAELKRTYLRQTEDDQGEEYDLRPTPEEIMRAGYAEATDDDGLVKGVPKYDPETGELIVPMPLARPKGPAPDEIPVAKAAIGYATVGLDEHVSPWMVPIRLLMPTNAFVMCLIFFAHLVNGIFVLLAARGLFLISFAPLLTAILLLAHYGCVVEEIGISERDELPAPLRGLSLGDDFWHPMMRFSLSLAICYVPAWYAYVLLGSPPLALLLAGAGTVLFPAILLTAITSGTILNLRPDRVLGVIRIGGIAYAGIVLLWVITGCVYVASLGAVAYHAAHIMDFGSGSFATKVLPFIAYPMLFVSIYLVHLFLWYIGLLYRARHNQFPWVLQCHIPSLKVERKFQELRREQSQQEGQPRRPPGSAMRLKG